MGIFDSLHIGYSGLSTSQAAIKTTSHNISNANTEGYSKQVVTQKVNYPIHNIPGDVGAGVHVDSVTRAHDEFVYGRLKSSESNVAYSDFMDKTLKEITTYAPDLDNLGVAKDIKDFFNSWSKVAQNPADDSSKAVLLRSMDSLSENLNSTSSKLHDLQDRLNGEFKNGIDEVNRIASEIVELNKNINKVENTNSARVNANDLRDQRDQLELKFAKIMNIEVSKEQVSITEYGQKANRTDMGVDYNINIGGFNIVDGVTFHPINADDSVNDSKLNAVYYIDHNQKKVDMTSYIRGGELGAVLDLRGDSLDATGRATNSKIQNYIDDLDTFAKGFSQAVNSIYASGASESKISDKLDVKESSKVLELDGIKEGSFQLKVYDASGAEVATKSITIDANTTFKTNPDGTLNTNSIIEQINKNSDDNGDNDGTNDIDDLFKADLVDGKFRLSPKTDKNYTIAIEDNGTNFAGAIGVNKLFEGNSALNLHVSSAIKNNPSTIVSNKAPINGNADLANQMVSLQYENISFEKPNGATLNQNIEEFYRYSSSKVATDAHQASVNKDAAEVLNKTVKDEFSSVSGVDMDEELVNLMQYQTAYQASAKIITAVDEMINTLLGMK